MTVTTPTIAEIARQTREAFAEDARRDRESAEAAAERFRQAEAKRITDDRNTRAVTFEMMKASVRRRPL